jgi:hypothetical protein
MWRMSCHWTADSRADDKSIANGRHLKKICAASFCETWQWLKFPMNGFRAQSRVSPVVGLLPLGRAHIETQADAGQGRAGQGDAARETLRDTV